MLLDMAADGLGDRVAIGSRDDGLSYDAIRRRAIGIARQVHDAEPETLALLAPMGPIVPATLFGAAWSGRSYAPLNFRLPEAARMELLHRLRPAVVVTEAWLAHEGGGLAYPDDPTRPAVLLFTSGTAAAPKAAVLEHDQLLSYVLTTVEFGAADEDEAVLVSVPPFHIAGVAAVLSATYAGRRVVPLPRFDAAAWLATARAESVTHAFLVPTMLARIVQLLDHDPSTEAPTLRHLAYGGARMPAPVIERALELLPDAEFVNAYGLTETSSTVCVLGPDDHRAATASADPVVRGRLASAGRPVPGVELRVVGANGTPLPPGQVGEIWVAGAQVGGEYLGEGSRRDAEGWLHTGDRGWLDADGYLFVEGRGDDTIIRGGENLATAEIEDALLRHEAVAAAVVVGLPDLEWGEKIAAMVALRPGRATGADELRRWVHEQLGSLKTPELLEIRDDLPHTATGKILRREVRAELERG